jgi:glycerol-3-phosphate dehydrogenase
MSSEVLDLAVIGGGINGTGIALDAAGRGAKVLLAEMGDLGSATSSASSKLIHGGLRYLEHYDFRLVREALGEREVLLAKAPHLIWPMRFVLPYVSGLRPRWMIRAGLFLYDHLARRQRIPGSAGVDLRRDPAGQPLARDLTTGFSYYDCSVDDARLVLVNAQAAAELGARVMTRTRVVQINRGDADWELTLKAAHAEHRVRARHIVNAAGPWAGQVDAMAARRGDNQPPDDRVRLVKGSHIVVPRPEGMGDTAYLLQSGDGRVVFALPFEERFAIIGTTDVAFTGDPGAVRISAEEEQYLLDLAQRFFRAKLERAEIVWRYSGVRPLYDDGDANPSAVTRDYRIVSGPAPDGPQLISCYGGKVTTYRRLSEDVVDRLARYLPGLGRPWTADATLPGGDIEGGDFRAFHARLCKEHPGFPPALLRRLARRHGSRISQVIGDAREPGGLGRDLGHGLSEREVLYMRDHEWARTADDVLWRRTKVGLHLSAEERDLAARRIERLISG